MKILDILILKNGVRNFFKKKKPERRTARAIIVCVREGAAYGIMPSTYSQFTRLSMNDSRYFGRALRKSM